MDPERKSLLTKTAAALEKTHRVGMRYRIEGRPKADHALTLKTSADHNDHSEIALALFAPYADEQKASTASVEDLLKGVTESAIEVHEFKGGGRTLWLYEWAPGENDWGFVVDAEALEVVGVESDAVIWVKDQATAEVLAGRPPRKGRKPTAVNYDQPLVKAQARTAVASVEIDVPNDWEMVVNRQIKNVVFMQPRGPGLRSYPLPTPDQAKVAILREGNQVNIYQPISEQTCAVDETIRMALRAEPKNQLVLRFPAPIIDFSPSTSDLFEARQVGDSGLILAPRRPGETEVLVTTRAPPLEPWKHRIAVRFEP